MNRPAAHAVHMSPALFVFNTALVSAGLAKFRRSPVAAHSEHAAEPSAIEYSPRSARQVWHTPPVHGAPYAALHDREAFPAGQLTHLMAPSVTSASAAFAAPMPLAHR